MDTVVTVKALKVSDRTTEIAAKSQAITVTGIVGTCSNPTMTVTTAKNAPDKVYVLGGGSKFTDNTAIAATWTFDAFVTNKDADCSAKKPTYSIACTPTALAGLFAVNASTRKITMTASSDVKYTGEIKCTITALGEDGRALTGSTGTAKVVMIPSACISATVKAKTAKPADLSIYYTLGNAAMKRNFNRWTFTDTHTCPTYWWTTAMTASTDAVKSDVTFTSLDRQINIAKINNDASGSLKQGVYTREFKA